LTLLCTLATWLNPWGWDLHRQVFHVATSLKSIALLVEDLPPDFATPSMSALAVMFLVGVVFSRAGFQARAALALGNGIAPAFLSLRRSEGSAAHDSADGGRGGTSGARPGSPFARHVVAFFCGSD